MTSPWKTRSFEAEPIIIVEVGEEKEKFYVHKDILCENSDFFNAALNGGFKEAKDRSISFPEDSPDTFNLFLSWAYFKEIKIEDNLNSMNFSDVTKGLCEIVDVFEFNDRINAINLNEHLIDKFYHLTFGRVKKKRLGDMSDEEAIRKLYQSPICPSPLRNMIVDFCVVRGASDICGDRQFLENFLSEQPEFAADMICRMSDKLLYYRDKEDGIPPKAEYYDRNYW